MPPKGTRSETYRSSRPRVRKLKKKIVGVENGTVGPSTLKRKLSSSSTDFPVFFGHFYRIIQFATTFEVISQKMVCRYCKKTVTFGECDNRGFGLKIVLKCKCGTNDIPSCPITEGAYEVNRRIVFVMRLLGVTHEGLNLFSGLMDIGKGISKSAYYAIIEHIYSASKVIFLNLIQKAVNEEKEENKRYGQPENELTVSGDGSWKKRGFNSLFGIATLIGNHTGKVIDCVIKSSYCNICTAMRGKLNSDEFQDWYSTHENECDADDKGSAGKMEVDGILQMFCESEEKFGVRYRNYVGDGDSKTFTSILDKQPYGPDFIMIKREDINHVAKRMGWGLRNVKKS